MHAPQSQACSTAADIISNQRPPQLQWITAIFFLVLGPAPKAPPCAVRMYCVLHSISGGKLWNIDVLL